MIMVITLTVLPIEVAALVLAPPSSMTMTVALDDNAAAVSPSEPSSDPDPVDDISCGVAAADDDAGRERSHPSGRPQNTLT